MSTTRAVINPLWFGAPVLAVYAAAFAIVRLLPQIDAPDVVAAALSVDLVVFVPALYYVVLVRKRRWPPITVVPVVLLSFAAASAIVPAEHHAPLRVLGAVLPVVELALVGFIGYKAYRIVRESRRIRTEERDFYDRMRRLLRGAIDVRAAADALAYEVSLVHYAFTMRRAEVPEGGLPYHRRSGYGPVYAAVLMVAAIELIAVHVLVRTWSETAVWIHLGLSFYGAVWFVGDYRAMRRRPHEIRADGLRIRTGLRWDVEVRWDQIAAVRRARQPKTRDGFLNAAPIGSPRYVIELSEPVTATGPYGIPREVRSVGLVVDDRDAFEQHLLHRGVPLYMHEDEVP